mgnify:CR=1 FL=1
MKKCAAGLAALFLIVIFLSPRAFAAGDELPKAFVLCSLGSGQTCYLSQLNTATLYKRSKASGLENL